MTVLLVVAGAVLGAPLRYLTDLLIQSRHRSLFPWGTFTVNVLGSFILGVVAGAVSAGAPGWLATWVGTGFCGALTTFSTFGFETVRLLESGALRLVALNVTLSVLVGLTACAAGWALATAW